MAAVSAVDTSLRIGPFAASQLANAILSWRYFFLGPAILSLFAAALIAVGAYRKGRTLRRLQHA